MGLFKDISIEAKLKLIVMLTTGVVLLLVTGAYIVNDMVSFRSKMKQDLSTLAEIIGTNSRAAVVFNDQQFAEETLAALKAKKHVVYACIYDKDQKVFAEFNPAGIAKPVLSENPHQVGIDFHDKHLNLLI